MKNYWRRLLAGCVLVGTAAWAALVPAQVIVTGGGGGTTTVYVDGAPTNGTYITQIPNALLSAEQALSLNGTGIMISTTSTGAVTTYAGTTCTGGQAVASLDASGVATCISAGGVASITIGSSTITGGTTGKLLYHAPGGVVGETDATGTGDMLASVYDPANIATQLVGRTSTQTLTNKTLTSPVLTTPNLGVPTFLTLTSATGLPISTGVSGLAAGIATWLATPSSANLITAVTDETGTGALVFATSPTFTTPILGTPTSVTLTNGTGLPVAGITGLGTGVATALGVAVSGSGAICLASGSACAGSATLTVGTSAVSGGTIGNVLYHASSNLLGEMTTTGSGTVLTLATAPTINQPVIKYDVATAHTSAFGATKSVEQCNATSAPVAMTLPAASSFTGVSYTLIKTDASTNACTVAMTGGDTIIGSGGTSDSIVSRGTAVTYTSNGSAWLTTGAASASMADPGADKILYFQNSSKSIQPVTVSTGLSFSSGTLTASGSGLTINSSTVASSTAGRVLYSDGTLLQQSGALTSGMPVFGGGTGSLTVGTLSGNTTKLVTTTGTLTSGRCVEIDASANFIQSAAACGGGAATIDAAGASSITNGTNNTLLYDNSGVVGKATVGTGLSLSGGVLTATGSASNISTRTVNTAAQTFVRLVWSTVVLNTDVYDTDTSHFTSDAALTGSGTLVATSGSPTITCAACSFTTELSVGQVIRIPGAGPAAGDAFCVVTNVGSNTTITVASQTQPATSATPAPTAVLRVSAALVARTAGTYSVSAGVRMMWPASVTGSVSAGISQNASILTNSAGTIVAFYDQQISTAVPAPGFTADMTTQVEMAQWDFLLFEAIVTPGSGNVDSDTTARTHFEFMKIF